MEQKNLLKEVKRHRSSALIDGVCMGIGFVFIVLGVMLPIILNDQIINGLLAIIGGNSRGSGHRSNGSFSLGKASLKLIKGKAQHLNYSLSSLFMKGP